MRALAKNGLLSYIVRDNDFVRNIAPKLQLHGTKQ